MPVLLGKQITQNGLGLMRFTLPTSSLPDEQSFKILKAAIAAGVTVWNGADFYGTPTNNSLHLMNRYFTAYPEDADKVIFTLKTGIVSMRTFSMDCSPENMRKLVDNALHILDGKKTIDIVQPARVDPNVPIEDSIKALAELVTEGKIGGVGLSETRASTIRRAAAVTKIEMAEYEISLWVPDVFENGVAATCGELNIPLVAHTPLGAGVLSGKIKSLDDLPANDYHRHFPRFQPDVFEKNLELVKEVEKLANIKGCTTAQLALNWIKSKSKVQGMPVLIPVSGASSESRIIENSMDIELTEEDTKNIDKILASFEVVGTRYPTQAMALVDQ